LQTDKEVLKFKPIYGQKVH